VKSTIQVHGADRMRVVLHPTDYDASIVLGPSECRLGGQDAPDGFPASGRNPYLFGANAFFADGGYTKYRLARFLFLSGNLLIIIW